MVPEGGLRRRSPSKIGEILGTVKSTSVIVLPVKYLDAMIYICIDALDECQVDRASFLRALREIIQHTELQKRLRIFLTGRSQVAHHVVKQIVGRSFCTVTLEASEEDILKYVRDQIESDDGGMDMSDEFTNEIINTILSTSDGIFLLPALQIRHVLEQTTIRSRREALKTMPTKLDDAFLDTIRRIESQPPSRKEQGMIGAQITARPFRMATFYGHSLCWRTPVYRKNLPYIHGV
ncbi:hypothetical protein FPQ18DRAFT_311305 [Pyronema domesticum]|nr:hypothetical protein FPQ18DRAFT_311305 [Pyronema domesticum]